MNKDDFRTFLEAEDMKNRGAGVIPVSRKTGKALLCKRAEGQSYPGSWCGFGGKMEVGETSREAALRELMEEAGIPASKVDLIDIGTYRDGDWRFHQYLGVVDYDESFAPNPRKASAWEVSDHVWVKPDDIRGLGALHPGLAHVISKELDRMNAIGQNGR